MGLETLFLLFPQALSPQAGHSVLEGWPTPQPWHNAILAHLAQGWTHLLAGIHLVSSSH